MVLLLQPILLVGDRQLGSSSLGQRISQPGQHAPTVLCQMAANELGLCSTHNFVDVCELLVRGNRNRLDEELVSALCIQRRLYFHGLEKNYEMISIKTYATCSPIDRTYQQPQPPF